MKPLCLLLIFGLCALAAEAAPAAGAFHKVGAAARADLERALSTLTRVRETIAAEQVPMAEELSRLETELTEARRVFDQNMRTLDTRNLDMANLKAEMKLRQDENGYLSNLLDEYARGFVTRINVSENERYDSLMQDAVLAAQSIDLPMAERFRRQVALVQTSITRLNDLVGGTRFPGNAVGPDGVIHEGTFALAGPVAMFSSDDGGKLSGLALPQTGSIKPMIRSLGKRFDSGINNLVASGTGIFPLDPTKGAALRDLVNKASLWTMFKRGGPIMWPLLAASLVALGVAVERIIFIAREKKRRDPKAVRELFIAVEHGQIERGIAVGRASTDYVAHAMAYALGEREKSLTDALLLASSAEIKRFKRGLPVLDTIITLAPLLGLLGTIVGMIGSFSILGGDLDSPAAITGGIAEALIATGYGLLIAITALLPFNYLQTRLEEARHDIEAAATKLELLMRAPAHRFEPEPQPEREQVAA
jgi:biopolymer transport protein ExbB